MGNVVPLHDPANYAVAQRSIKRLWDEGLYIPHPHALQRMEERGLNNLDIQHIIRYGKIVDHTMPSSLWRYKIQGRTLDRRTASCIVEMDAHSLILVTVISRKKSNFR